MSQNNNTAIQKSEELFELITHAKHCVVLTGAGISTLSGIPDFRGVGGLYNRKDIDANRLFDIHAFRKDPSYYYEHSRDFLYEKAAKPNIVHIVLAKLEEKGHIQAIITQNVDILHQKAGSKIVFELHGSPLVHTCLACRKTYSFDEILKQFELESVPHCIQCKGVIKPNIVFFGEQLPEYDLSMAQMHAQKADLFIVLGTSLTVYPAAALPEFAVHNGAKLAIVNASPTFMDADACYHATDLGAIFENMENLMYK